MKVPFVLGVFALVLAAGRLQAADSAEDVLGRVRKAYDRIEDAEVRFTQKVKFSLARIEQEVSGTLFFKKENKYRVEFEGQTVVTDGETVWSYSAANNQVLIDRFKMDERSISPERILTAAPEDFVPSVVGQEKLGRVDVTVLKMVPQKPAMAIKSMKLWVSESDWLTRKVEIVDLHGKETAYIVNSIKTNAGVPDTRFHFEPPDGVEVVDLR
jgi:outer membrane lipoprotein carrier protein